MQDICLANVPVSMSDESPLLFSEGVVGRFEPLTVEVYDSYVTVTALTMIRYVPRRSSL